MKKEFTINVDVQIFAESKEKALDKLAGIMHGRKYWVGEVTDESGQQSLFDHGVEPK